MAATVTSGTLRLPSIRSPAKALFSRTLIPILPSVLSLVGIPYGPQQFDGRSLFSIQDHSAAVNLASQVYMGELLIQNRNILRTIVKDHWKYIAAAKWLLPIERPGRVQGNNYAFERNSKLHVDTWNTTYEELYDLSADRGELVNLIGSAVQKRDELRKILSDYRRECKSRSPALSNQLVNEGKLTPNELKKLKSLGYL